MFTGIVEEVGVVRQAARIGGGVRITVAAGVVLEELEIGASIALDGVCQTVVRRSARTFTVEAVGETLAKTTLGRLRAGRRVNLERALKLGDRLGGHIVQGHVNGTGRICGRTEAGGHFLLEVEVPGELGRYIVEEGSIAVDGVSLTVARLRGRRVGIRVVPHTAARTTLGAGGIGEPVNIEVDVLGRYVERLLSPSGRPEINPGDPGGFPGLEGKLARWGYYA